MVRSTKCFCIFQNVSSTFARFIGEAKGDIRISQLNTFFRLYFLLTIILRSCRRLYSPTYYSSTASGPPSLAREGYKKQKMPRFCETLHILSIRCLDQRCILSHLSNAHWKPNKFWKRRSSFALARTKDVQALGLLVSVNWTHYCAYISDLSNS